ncbi:MAG: hypothetical protein VX046_03175, partial [Bacteroidota bacterium]|nr:hypothetical protein [Bacteroidota bacterium]
MSLLNSVLKVFVGDKSKQDVKAILPIVNQIKEFESKIAALSNDALRAKTATFKDQIKMASNDNEERISALQQEANNTTDIDRKEDIYQEIDSLND